MLEISKNLRNKLERFKHNVSEETATDSNEDILEMKFLKQLLTLNLL